jgi:hypothetical protein
VLARWLTRRVEFSFRGQQWPLIFTHRVLLTAQDLAPGSDLLNAGLAKPSAKLTRALFFTALSAAGAPCSLEQVGKEIATRFLPAQAILMDAWRASMPEPKKPAKGDAPKKAEPYTWLEHWSGAREDHGLSLDEWLDMTPRMYRALQERRIKHLQREEYMVGVIGSTIAMYAMSPPQTPRSPESFMVFNPIEEPEIPMGERIRNEVRKMKRIQKR